MKPKDIPYLLGFRPKPKRYPYKVVRFDLPSEGIVEYAQWLHPGERPKEIAQTAVDELRRFLKPGDVAIDIGAHTGDSTLPMALAAGPTGCVLALEPNPSVFAVLEKNATLNEEKARIIPLKFAATPEDGEVEFEYSDAGFCNGGRHEGVSRWRHGHAFTLTVEGRNLPSYLAARYPDLIPRVRFIKVDAEGYDHTVLTTMRGILAEAKPFIKAEVFKHTREDQRKAFFLFLHGLGYRTHLVESDSRLCGPELNVGDVMSRKHYDILCVPR